MAGKRLRRRIRELSGLDKLSGEDRYKLASKILNDNDMKQDMCLQCPGLTYKDIERTCKAILTERHYQQEPTEEELVPEKYGREPIQEVFKPTGKKIQYKTLTRS